MKIKYTENTDIAYEVKKCLDIDNNNISNPDGKTKTEPVFIKHGNLEIIINFYWEHKEVKIKVNDKQVALISTDNGMSNFSCAATVQKIWNCIKAENQ